MTESDSARKVLVAGASGLVGKELVRLLLEAPTVSEVRALVRRAPSEAVIRLQPIVTDFENLDGVESHLHVDAVFCALGTTIRTAGSKEAFRRVDFDYPLKVAKLAKGRGVRHFLLVSAAGADARSKVFYSRVKGELEDALRGVGFETLTIARPSLLLGPREERRLGETLAKYALLLAPSQFRGVHAHQVAGALVESFNREPGGVEILDNRALRINAVASNQQPVTSNR